jgi:hypothetical protein
MNFSVFLAALLSFSLSVTTAEDIEVNCRFGELNDVYTCNVMFVTIPDNLDANFIITGNHLTGRTNANVDRINILASNIPFIIPQLFTEFPNVKIFDNLSGSLLRIQSNAFANARNLRVVNIAGSRNFNTIEENAFAGAKNLLDLHLSSNGIQTIHENAFASLDSLKTLEMHGNQIRELPVNLFSPLRSLELVDLFLNRIPSRSVGTFWIIWISFTFCR